MSTTLSRKRVFSLKDFKAADRVDRFYIHMMQPSDFELNDQDKRYLEVLKRAYVIMCEGHTRREMVIQIAALEEEASQNTYRILRDAESLFGRFEDVDRRIQRGIIRERLELLAKKAKENEDIEEERKCYEALIKLDRLDQPEMAANADTTLPMLVITDDPAALEAEDAEIVEDDTSSQATLSQPEAEGLPSGQAED